ncbi:MAG: HAD-IA family hydrolase, partial [Pseudomonadota bacterium]
ETNETLFPRVEEMLDALTGESTLLGIATGKSRHGLDRLLALHRLTERFVTTVTADEAASKPAPEMIHRAVGQTGVSLGRTVMVGDSTYDVLMAAAAGAPALGVCWGYQPADKLRAAGARHVADEVMDIPRLVNAICPP